MYHKQRTFLCHFGSLDQWDLCIDLDCFDGIDPLCFVNVNDVFDLGYDLCLQNTLLEFFSNAWIEHTSIWIATMIDSFFYVHDDFCVLNLDYVILK